MKCNKMSPEELAAIKRMGKIKSALAIRKNKKDYDLNSKIYEKDNNFLACSVNSTLNESTHFPDDPPVFV